MSAGQADAPAGPLVSLLQRVVDVRREEVAALVWSCAYFFFVLSSYFIIRPLREEMGVAGGVRNLQWLFTGTLVAMLLVHPPFAAMVARFPRRKFVPLANRFFLANLGIFFVLMRFLWETERVWVGRAFFVWTSVFNLFVVSVFWSVMTDSWATPQGKRLFGFIGFGGTFGGIVGSTLTAVLAPKIGVVNLILISAALLELSTLAMQRLTRLPPVKEVAPNAAPEPDPNKQLIGGSAFAGIANVLRSPYLLGICAYMLLFTFGSTVLYFQQADIAQRTFTDPAVRTAFFARIDLAVNVLTLLTQIFLTGRIVKLLGVPVTLMLLPGLSVIGFILLGGMPVIAVFVVFQVLRRAGEYAVARPTRELLYIVVPREDKYKAKNLIDTFVYRAGDQIAAWSTAGITALGLTLAGMSYVAAPLAAVWLLIGLWLGRRQEARARESAATATRPLAPTPAAARL